MKRLENKIAVVTGASKGIGAATAILLATSGASVIVNYLTSKEGADRVVGQIQAEGGEAFAVCADVSTETGISFLIAETKRLHGRIDILINNAGVYGFSGIESVTADEYHRQFDLNVLGVLLTIKAALPLFPKTGGSIVNLSSTVSLRPPMGAAIAGGSKGALDVITKSLAKELGPRQIRVNALNAGVVMTEGFIAGGLAGSAFEKHAIALTPLGRIGQPDDIAYPALFLASDESRWITGETIAVAGGE